jgi:hypothetical protein
MTQSIKKIEDKIGTLSNPSKMPSYAWGIPIEYCDTGMKLAKIDDTICKKCYAGKGCYTFPATKAMYQKRYDAIEMNEWVDYMSELITFKYKNIDKSRLFHRWFDSGDVQSYSHLMKIFEICENTPHIKHWLATKEYQIINKIKEEDVPKNLCLRVSATKVDGAIPKFWKWTSGVHKDKRHKGKECRAYLNNNECGSCRACWNRNIKQVSYKEH